MFKPLTAKSIFSLNTREEPYRPPQINKAGLAKPIATWRLVVGTILRVIGVVLIAIPLLAIVMELARSGFKDPSLDLAGILLAIVVYIAFGRLFLIAAKRVFTSRRLFRKQDKPQEGKGDGCRI